MFDWSGFPRYKLCAICGRDSLDAGFINLMGDTLAHGPDGGVVGVVDISLCAGCVKEIAVMVGCATRQQVEELVQDINDRDEEIKKLKDEIQAWQQRFVGMVNLTADDFDRLADVFATASPSSPPLPSESSEDAEPTA